MFTHCIFAFLAAYTFGISVFDLKKQTHSLRRRKMDWSLFLLSYIAVIASYFIFFFPKNVPFRGEKNLSDYEAKMLLSGQLVLGCFLMIGFMLSYILSRLPDDPWYSEETPFIRKYVALPVLLILLFCVPYFSFVVWQQKPESLEMAAITHKDSIPTSVGVVKQQNVLPTTDSISTRLNHKDNTIGSGVTIASDTVVISSGGSLCGSLKVTPSMALAIAKKYHFRYWYKKKKLYVLIYPTYTFYKMKDVWHWEIAKKIP